MFMFMFMVVIMFVGCVSHGQRQQGERQGEKKTAHSVTPAGKMNDLLCDLITVLREFARVLGDTQGAWEHGVMKLLEQQ